MKKALLFTLICVMVLVLVLTGCGKKSPRKADEPKEPEKQEEERTHTIEFDGLKLEIPARLELNESASADNYRTYDLREDGKQVESLMITSIDSVVHFSENYTLEDAARSIKGMSENIDTRSDLSGPVIGPEAFDGKYNMISLDFKETIADQVNYVRYTYLYCDDRTFAMTYKNREEDYSVFDKMLKSGSYTSGNAAKTDDDKDNKKDKGDKDGKNDKGGNKVQKISVKGMTTEIPADWKYSKDKSNDNARYYMSDDFRFVLSFADTGTKVTDKKLGEITDKVLETSGDSYKGKAYYDYTVGNGINAKIVYIDKEDSEIGKYERLIVFAKGSVVYIAAGDCADNNFDDFDEAMRKVKL